jgi:hypothetical protein
MLVRLRTDRAGRLSSVTNVLKPCARTNSALPPGFKLNERVPLSSVSIFRRRIRCRHDSNLRARDPSPGWILHTDRHGCGCRLLGGKIPRSQGGGSKKDEPKSLGGMARE